MVENREITFWSPPGDESLVVCGMPGVAMACCGWADAMGGGAPNEVAGACPVGDAETVAGAPGNPAGACPRRTALGTWPESGSDRLTLAICEAGRVARLFHTTNCCDSSGRRAHTASYIWRGFVSLARILIEDTRTKQGINILRVGLQGPLEMAFGRDEVALGQFGDAQFGLVVLLQGASRPEGIREDLRFLQGATGTNAHARHRNKRKPRHKTSTGHDPLPQLRQRAAPAFTPKKTPEITQDGGTMSGSTQG